MTPEDREMLEMAAKAAGLRVWESCGQMFVDPPPNDGKVSGVSWNPLKDDGDALRLVVRLKQLNLWTKPYTGHALDGWATDPYAATRRAIVKAAAAAGRTVQ